MEYEDDGFDEDEEEDEVLDEDDEDDDYEIDWFGSTKINHID